MKRKLSLILIILIALIVIFSYLNKLRVYTATINDALDTITQITLITNDDGSKYIEDITQIINKYDKMFSHTDKESEIYRFNVGEKVSFSKETYDIIKSSEEFFLETQGAFDLTIGAVSALWNKTFENGVLPYDDKIKKALDTVDYSSLIFEDNNIKKTILNQEINLGAVAKGYISDVISNYMIENKIDNGLINLGGNIYAKGRNKDNKKWSIGVLDPLKTDSVLLTLDISDKFVITSGNYLRYADINSVRYHHIVDARSGYPADNELNSVTIISDSGFLADILSTSCFLLGYEESIPLLEKYNVCGIFATKDNKVYYSKELKNSIKKMTDNYDFIEF